MLSPPYHQLNVAAAQPHQGSDDQLIRALLYATYTVVAALLVLALVLVAGLLAVDGLGRCAYGGCTPLIQRAGIWRRVQMRGALAFGGLAEVDNGDQAGGQAGGQGGGQAGGQDGTQLSCPAEEASTGTSTRGPYPCHAKGPHSSMRHRWRTLRALARLCACSLLLLALAYMMVLPSAWWHEQRHEVWKYIESRLLPAKRAMLVLVLTCGPLVATWLTIFAIPGRHRLPRMPDLSRWRLPRTEAMALLLWLLPMVSWHLFRLQRYEGLDSSWSSLKHASLTLGLTAVLNIQVLLLPVSHSAPLLALLGKPSDRLIWLHRFLGATAVIFVLLHGAYFVFRWSAEGQLLAQLLDWPSKGVANLPGVLAATAGILISLTSLPVVRRQAFELFAYTHRPAAALFLLGAALHWNGFIYYTLPSTLLYLSDLAAHITTRLRPGVPVLHARYAHGVLSLTLGCTPWLRAPQPLHWVLLQVPSLSALQWHAFSVAAITPARGQMPATFGLTIKVIDKGWTGALCAWLAAHGGSNGDGDGRGCDTSGDGNAGDGGGRDGGSDESSGSGSSLSAALASVPKVRVAGWYGLAFDAEAVLRHRQPLLCVCGGSGGAPCAALLRQLAEHAREHQHPPHITLIWTCTTVDQLREYIEATALLHTVEIFANLTVRLHASSHLAFAEPRRASEETLQSASATAAGSELKVCAGELEPCPVAPTLRDRPVATKPVRRSAMLMVAHVPPHSCMSLSVCSPLCAL